MSAMLATSPNADADADFRRVVRLTMPRTPNQLHSYIATVLGFHLPRHPLIAGHSAPFDYLEHSFFEDQGGKSRDCLVWASRGGGKTQIAAIATLLDLIFKPGIQVRILGGSFDQSSRMYRYLKRILESPVICDLGAGHRTGRHVELRNGARVEVLAQSERAVRGNRVHKLRCDEVELFDAGVWEAAQLITRSGRCGSVTVRAAIEALSTMHKPFGLMQRLVQDAPSRGRRIFRWNVLDTLHRCEAWRMCGMPAAQTASSAASPAHQSNRDDVRLNVLGESGQDSKPCLLWDECQGRAKSPQARGFFYIDDAIVQKQRVGVKTWNAEMLCEEPALHDSVYPEFDRAIHVFGSDQSDADHAHRADSDGVCIAGIDFGYRAPTVLVWAILADGVLTVVDELAQEGATCEQFMAMATQRMKSRRLPRPQWIGGDPAGHQRSDQTGVSTITVWKRAGWPMRTHVLPIEAGVDAVRKRLRRADGFIGLRIHARCRTLIESITKYHYPPDRREARAPVKDGTDHAADALRYMIVNLDCAPRPLKIVEF